MQGNISGSCENSNYKLLACLCLVDGHYPGSSVGQGSLITAVGAHLGIAFVAATKTP